MKKLLTGLLAMLTCFACATAVACGDDNKDNSSSTPINTESSDTGSSDTGSSDTGSSDSSGDETDDELADAAAYLEELYRDKDAETRADYEVLPAIWGYNIAWSVTLPEGVTEGVSIKTEGDKVIVDVDELLDEDLTYVLTGVVSNEAGQSVTVSFTRVVLAAPSMIPQAITEAPVEGVAYKYHVYQSTLAQDMYFAGAMDGYYFKTTTESAEAVDVYAEYVAGSTTEFYLYFTHVTDGKQYFGVQLSADGAHDNIVYTSTPVSTFVWNADLGTVTTHLAVNKNGEAADYYFGNYSTHKTISASMLSYAGGAGNNVGHLVTMVDKNSIAPEAKIANVKEALTVQADHKMNKELTLTTVDERHPDVAISWAISESTCAVLAGDKLTLTIPAEATTVTLTATLTCGDKTDTKEFTLNLGPAIVLNANPTPAEIVAAAFQLENGEALNGEFTLEGVITKVNTAYNEEYANVTVTITVEGKSIECYRLTGDGVDVIKVGDTINVTGKIKNYNDKVEFDSGCKLNSYSDGSDVDLSTSIANILAGEDGTYQAKGVVIAVNAQSFLISDGTGIMLVYKGYDWSGDLIVGDKVIVNGDTSVYGAAKQFGKEATYTKDGTDTVTHPEAKALTAAECDAYATMTTVTPIYATVSGTLSVSSGKYFNLAIDGATITGSITYPDADDKAALEALSGKNISIVGYITGTASSGKYLNFMVTAFEEITTPDDSSSDTSGGDVEITTSSIADILAGENGTYQAEGVVIAVNAQSFLISDGTGIMLVYKGYNWTCDVAVGDKLTVNGDTSVYGCAKQFGNAATYTKGGTDTVTHPEAVALTAAECDAYASATTVTPIYVTLNGSLSVSSGKYFNLAIDGATIIGSITYPDADDKAALEALNGKEISVVGYVTGTASSGKYLNLMVTSFEEIIAGEEVPTYTLTFADTEETLKVAPGATLELPTPTAPTGKEFVKWVYYTYEYDEVLEWEVEVEHDAPATMPENDLTLVAVWKVIPYTITVTLPNSETVVVKIGVESVYNEETWETEIYDYTYGPGVEFAIETALKAFRTETKAYEVEGLTYDEDGYAVFAELKNYEFTAKEVERVYTIYLNRGESKTYKFDETIELPTPDAIDGAEFKGWVYYTYEINEETGEEVEVKHEVTEDLKASPAIDEMNFLQVWDVEKYTLTLNNVEVLNEETWEMEIGTLVINFGVMTDVENGIDITLNELSWLLESNLPEGYKWDNDLPETWALQNYVFTAIDANLPKYELTLVNDGVENITAEYYAGKTISLPTPTADGKTFLGWFNGENKVEEVTMPESDLTLTAKWEVNVYTLTIVNGETSTEFTFGVEKVENRTAHLPTDLKGILEANLPKDETGKFTYAWTETIPETFELKDYTFTVLVIETLTIPEAIELGASKAHNTYTTDKYYVNGIIVAITNTTYGNMTIADELGNELTVYGSYSADGSTQFGSMTNKPVVGQVVKFLSVVGAYSGSPQLKNAWIVEISEATEAQKIAVEKLNVSVAESVKGAREIEVATAGTLYADVVIAWEVTAGNEIASIADGVLIIANPAEDTTVTVVATLTLGDVTDTKEFTIAVAHKDEGAAEPTTLAKFDFGANGSAEHVDGTDLGTSKAYTEGGYTLTLTSLNKVYGPAYDAKGNSCIKLGTSSKAGSFSFTVDANVTSVVIYVAKYKSNSATVTVNGTATTLTKASNNGEYDAITIDTTTNKTVSFAVTSGYRVMIDAIEFIGL